jgi:hypothetical protein
MTDDEADNKKDRERSQALGSESVQDSGEFSETVEKSESVDTEEVPSYEMVSTPNNPDIEQDTNKNSSED